MTRPWQHPDITIMDKDQNRTEGQTYFHVRSPAVVKQRSTRRFLWKQLKECYSPLSREYRIRQGSKNLRQERLVNTIMDSRTTLNLPQRPKKWLNAFRKSARSLPRTRVADVSIDRYEVREKKTSKKVQNWGVCRRRRAVITVPLTTCQREKERLHASPPHEAHIVHAEDREFQKFSKLPGTTTSIRVDQSTNTENHRHDATHCRGFSSCIFYKTSSGDCWYSSHPPAERKSKTPKPSQRHQLPQTQPLAITSWFSFL